MLPDFSPETARLVLSGKTVAEASAIASERARLEREVVEKAKAYGRAARATEDHMKTSGGAQDQDSADGWQLLRDLESSWENLMLDSVDALLTFESEQEKKS